MAHIETASGLDFQAKVPNTFEVVPASLGSGAWGRAHDIGSQFENNYFTEMCSGSDAGSYLNLIDFYDERFGRVWRGSYSFDLGGFWWSRTPRGLRNVLV